MTRDCPKKKSTFTSIPAATTIAAVGPHVVNLEELEDESGKAHT